MFKLSYIIAIDVLIRRINDICIRYPRLNTYFNRFIYLIIIHYILKHITTQKIFNTSYNIKKYIMSMIIKYNKSIYNDDKFMELHRSHSHNHSE